MQSRNAPKARHYRIPIDAGAVGVPANGSKTGGLPWMAVASKLTNYGRILRLSQGKGAVWYYREAPSVHRMPWSGSAFRREGVGERGRRRGRQRTRRIRSMIGH